MHKEGTLLLPFQSEWVSFFLAKPLSRTLSTMSDTNSETTTPYFPHEKIYFNKHLVMDPFVFPVHLDCVAT